MQKAQLQVSSEAHTAVQPLTWHARLRMLEALQECLVVLTGPCAWKYSHRVTVLQTPQLNPQGPRLKGQRSLCKTS